MTRHDPSPVDLAVRLLNCRKVVFMLMYKINTITFQYLFGELLFAICVQKNVCSDTDVETMPCTCCMHSSSMVKLPTDVMSDVILCISCS